MFHAVVVFSIDRVRRQEIQAAIKKGKVSQDKATTRLLRAKYIIAIRKFSVTRVFDKMIFKTLIGS